MTYRNTAKAVSYFSDIEMSESPLHTVKEGLKYPGFGLAGVATLCKCLKFVR